MKKKYALGSLLALSTLVLSTAIASPVGFQADIYCPSTQGSSNVITNFGDYISGYGVEYLLSQTNPAYFRSTAYVQNVPATLINYFNDSISYNSTTGVVSCNYQSNIATDPTFSVSYFVTNGKGGAVQWQSANAIGIMFPVGLRG